MENLLLAAKAFARPYGGDLKDTMLTFGKLAANIPHCNPRIRRRRLEGSMSRLSRIETGSQAPNMLKLKYGQIFTIRSSPTSIFPTNIFLFNERFGALRRYFHAI